MTATSTIVTAVHSAADSFSVASFWLGVAGFVLTLAGLAIAFRQIRKTKSAAEAAREAASSMSNEMRRLKGALLYPDLRAYEAEFDLLIEGDFRHETRLSLRRYRRLASETAAHLRQAGVRGQAVVLLQRSIHLARGAEDALSETGRSVADCTRIFKRALGEAIDASTADLQSLGEP